MFLFFSWASSASAQVTVQSSGTQYATLTEAVANAVGGDTLTMAPGPYSEHVVIDRQLTIVGPGATLSYSGSESEVVSVQAGVTLAISGVTLQSTTSRGITANYTNDLTLDDVVFDGTTSAAGGGGLFAVNPTSLVLTNVTFDGTTAAYGGGIAARSTALVPLDLTDVTFTGTGASGDGGAIYLDTMALDCTGCTFDGTSAFNGGGIFDLRGSDLVVRDSQFLGTSATFDGGAIDAAGTLIVTGTTFCGTTGAFGGAIAGAPTSAMLANDLFIEPSAAAGGGIYAIDGAWDLENVTFAGVDGVAANFEGAGTTADVVNTLFLDSSGFALGFGTGATATRIDYSAFWGNVGDVSGASLGGTNVTGVSPQLAAWSADGDCTNDVLVPIYGSPLVDAGDPALDDPDGTRSDIGATGGPGAAPPDGDGDGFSMSRDCNDADPSAFVVFAQFPDQDLDGVGDRSQGDSLICGIRPGWSMLGDDCDDTDPTAVYIQPTCPDADGDGYGDARTATETCGVPAGHLTTCDDCEDADPTQSPEPFEIGPDADGDGWGDDYVTTLEACDLLPGYAITGDCDDSDPAVWEQALVCNDADHDGFGAVGSWPFFRCVLPVPGSGYAATCTDCDDSDPSVGENRWWPDLDGDGYAASDYFSRNDCDSKPPGQWVQQLGDCRPLDASAYPDAPEVCDEIDQDCDDDITDAPGWRTFWADTDGDGFGDAGRPFDYCEGRPGWVEVTGDCVVDDGEAYPGAPERCNAVDDDCNGAVDDGPPQAWYLDSDGDGVGGEGTAEQQCPPDASWVALGGDCDDQDPAISPRALEECNGVDDDCDGSVDLSDCGPPDAAEAQGPGESGGCGCSTPAAPSAFLVPFVLVTAAFGRRRHRSFLDLSQTEAPGAMLVPDIPERP